MAAKKDLSIEEMMALARGEKSGSKPAPASPPAQGEKSEAAPEPKAPAAKPAAKPAAGGTKGGELSIADMMAAARGEKKGAAAAPKAEKPASTPAAKAAPKPAAKAEATKAEAAKAESAPLETSSILAAGSGAHPRPMSKAEAAAKGQMPTSGKAKLAVPPMPEKPDYAKALAATPAEETRRGFLSTVGTTLAGTPLAIGFSTLAVTHILWLLGLARFMFPNILAEPPVKFKAGSPDEFAPGQVKTVPEFGVWVVRHEYEGKQVIYALKMVCTHLGCTPNWLEAEQKFKCPCHGSGFYKDGVNFEGPAPRPLERYQITRAPDGQLEVDKSRTFLEEKGEWKDAASFVEV